MPAPHFAQGKPQGEIGILRDRTGNIAMAEQVSQVMKSKPGQAIAGIAPAS
ncbi:hypothetical protein BN1183_AX_00530 [Pantoea ananatis]|nr:hypothetical protein BN1183_AX_00530 [Pantoea ananatis]